MKTRRHPAKAQDVYSQKGRVSDGDEQREDGGAEGETNSVMVTMV